MCGMARNKNCIECICMAFGGVCIEDLLSSILHQLSGLEGLSRWLLWGKSQYSIFCKISKEWSTMGKWIQCWGTPRLQLGGISYTQNTLLYWLALYSI